MKNQEGVNKIGVIVAVVIIAALIIGAWMMNKPDAEIPATETSMEDKCSELVQQLESIEGRIEDMSDECGDIQTRYNERVDDDASAEELSGIVAAHRECLEELDKVRLELMEIKGEIEDCK